MVILTLVRLEDGTLLPTINGKEIRGCKQVSINSNEAGGGCTLFFPLEFVDLTVETPVRNDS